MGPDEKGVNAMAASTDIRPEITLDQERIKKATEDIRVVWESVSRAATVAMEAFGAWIRSVAAQIEAKHELETALRWASCYYRPAFNRYRHTKKKRTRKKYAKRILAWYREEVL